MKKLFFLAAIAIVAVGSAYAETFHLGSPTGPAFTCEIAESPNCVGLVGAPPSTKIYDNLGVEVGQLSDLAIYTYVE